MASYNRNGNHNGHRNGSQHGRQQAANGRHNRQKNGMPPSVMRRRGKHVSGGRLLRLILLSVVGGAVLALLFTTVTLAVAYAQVAGNLKPRLDSLKTHQSFESSRIYDRDGTLLFEIFGEGRREPVDLNAISKQVIDATIAIEDASFYENPGVDYIGIARALYQNLRTGAEVSGASTITQQVIKNVVLTAEEREYRRRYERKIKEIILAQELSTIYSKDEILELYLNEIPYGNLSYGIQAAAKNYFGVSANKLNLAQASLLAGLPQSPTTYNPINYLERGNLLPGIQLPDGWLEPDFQPSEAVPPPKARQVAVLRQMVVENYITEPEARRTAAQDLEFADQDFSLLAPHFVFYVKEYLEKKYGAEVVAEGGLRITTTLDLELQNMAQEEASRRIAELEAQNRNIHNAAVVVLQPNTGHILAMVGSVGYTRTLATTTPGEEGNVLNGKDNVTVRQRQPGSALKPFTYLAGMEQNLRYDTEGGLPGLNPGTILWDVETRFPIRFDASNANLHKCEPPEEAYWYCPHNFDMRWHGPMRMRMALANSLNMPAVKALKRTGVGQLIDLLHRAGVAPTSLNRGLDWYGLSLTLGGGEVSPLDLATAYNTLASGGRYFPPTPILKITDAKGKVIEEHKPVPIPEEPNQDTSRCVPPTEQEYLEGKRIPPGTQCIDPRLAFIITDMMTDNQARTPMFGRDTVINLNPPAAVKTGTTDDFRDAWASGFAPYVTITVWTGNNNNEPTDRVESVTGGGVIWARLMQRIRQNERVLQLLAETFGGKAPRVFPDEFPGVVRKAVCDIAGRFGGPNTELMVPGMKHIKLNPRHDELTEKIISWSWSSGPQSIASLQRCEGADDLPPIPTETPTPEVTATATPPPGSFFMPNLVGYGENQAKEILAGLGVAPSRITVHYQSRSSLGPLFDRYPPYAVVSTVPGAGSVINANTTVILGIRSPQDDGGKPPPTATPAPPPGPVMPNLVGYGENQAKEILARLGVQPSQIGVDYQSRSRLGALFDQYPPYAVVSTSPPAGTPLQPGMTIILGIRSPEDDGAKPSP